LHCGRVSSHFTLLRLRRGVSGASQARFSVHSTSVGLLPAGLAAVSRRSRCDHTLSCHAAMSLYAVVYAVVLTSGVGAERSCRRVHVLGVHRRVPTVAHYHLWVPDAVAAGASRQTDMQTHVVEIEREKGLGQGDSAEYESLTGGRLPTLEGDARWLSNHKCPASCEGLIQLWFYFGMASPLQ